MVSLWMMFLLSIASFGTVPSPSDWMAYNIMLNTARSVRELNSIVNETSKLNDNVEKILTTVDQTVYYADRVIMWAEDMKMISEIEITNIDDFNFVLAYLKQQKDDLRSIYNGIFRELQENKRDRDGAVFDENRSKMRAKKYSLEEKRSMSVNQAAVVTANNTQDAKVELALQNTKLDKIIQQLSKISDRMADGKADKEIDAENKESFYRVRKKGLLTKKMVKRGR